MHLGNSLVSRSLSVRVVVEGPLPILGARLLFLIRFCLSSVQMFARALLLEAQARTTSRWCAAHVPLASSWTQIWAQFAKFR